MNICGGQYKMPKSDAYYFSHDYGSRNDPKLQKVLMKLGQEGKGVFWDLVEMLYEQEGYLLLSDCESYAFALRSDTDCISSLINDFKLFENDGERFWSNSVLNRLNMRKEKSNKASEAALKRWNNRKDANAMRTHSGSNARKGKERKGNKIIDMSGKPDPCTFFIQLFNNLKGYPDAPAKYKLNDKIKLHLKARIKEGYSSEDFKKAILNCKSDPYHVENGLKYLTPEFITRAEKLEMYLNKEPKKQRGGLPNGL